MKKEVSVAAVVVTYNRKDMLQQCLRKLFSQTRRPDEIILVDNASTDGTADCLKSDFGECLTIVSLAENRGGAGGFAEGMRLAYGKGHDWLWIMDDDAFAKNNCLELLLDASLSSYARICAPLLCDKIGKVNYGVLRLKNGDLKAMPRSFYQSDSPSFVELVSFVGPLIHRSVIESVGFPIPEFFISADDVEYFLRLEAKGWPILFVPRAVIEHSYGRHMQKNVLGRTSSRPDLPSWRLYYSVRNLGYIVFHQIADFKSILGFCVWQMRYTLGDIIYESDWKERTEIRLQAILDAVRSRLGKTVLPKKAQPKILASV